MCPLHELVSEPTRCPRINVPACLCKLVKELACLNVQNAVVVAIWTPYRTPSTSHWRLKIGPTSLTLWRTSLDRVAQFSFLLVSQGYPCQRCHCSQIGCGPEYLYHHLALFLAAYAVWRHSQRTHARHSSRPTGTRHTRCVPSPGGGECVVAIPGYCPTERLHRR